MTTALPEFATAETIASLVGLSARHVRNYEAEGVIRKAGRNRYPLGASVLSIFDHVRASVATKAKSADRFRDLRAEMMVLELAEKRRELIPMAEAEAALLAVVGAVNAEIGSLAARITRDVPLRVKIQKEVDASMNRVADKLDETDAALNGKQASLPNRDDD